MWARLEQGDIIDVVAPSSSNLSEEQIKASLQQIENAGYKVRYPADLVSTDHIFHANNDEYRIKSMKLALLAEDSKAIWALRGGYGAAKVIQGLLDLGVKPPKEKVLIGFSDITALHLFLSESWGWHPIHGAVLSQSGNPKFNQKNFDPIISMLGSHNSCFDLAGLSLVSAKAPVCPINGELSGGNLCLIQTSIGTPWQMTGEGKILIIEDGNERGYRIDRMLHHLLQAGILKGVKAMVCNFTGGDESDGTNLIAPALRDFASLVDFPIFTYAGIGHGYNNAPFVYGASAEIIADGESFKLTYSLPDY